MLICLLFGANYVCRLVGVSVLNFVRTLFWCFFTQDLVAWCSPLRLLLFQLSTGHVNSALGVWTGVESPHSSVCILAMRVEFWWWFGVYMFWTCLVLFGYNWITLPIIWLTPSNCWILAPSNGFCSISSANIVGGFSVYLWCTVPWLLVTVSYGFLVHLALIIWFCLNPHTILFGGFAHILLFYLWRGGGCSLVQIQALFVHV